MSNNEVANIYKQVIDDVIQNVRSDFVNMGIDEQVLIDLKELWENKLAASRVVANFNNASSQQQVMRRASQHSEYEGAPSGYIEHAYTGQPYVVPFYPSVQTQPLMSGPPSGMDPRYPHPHSNPHPHHLMHLHHPALDDYGRPRQYQHPSQQQSHSQDQPSSKRLRQNDGTEDDTDDKYNFIIQFDGPDDADDEDADLEDYIQPVSAQPLAESPDEVLGSDLDDEDDLSGTDDNEIDVIICQFEKVSRIKQKWRCLFKDGIMNIRNRDYMFHRASGEFDW